jgi:hypothetical protein
MGHLSEPLTVSSFHAKLMSDNLPGKRSLYLDTRQQAPEHQHLSSMTAN